MDDTSILLSLEMLREAYMLAAVNLKKARDRQPKKVTNIFPNFKVSGLVLLRNHKNHTPWDARYMSSYHICKVINDRAYDLQDFSGHDKLAPVC